MDKRRCEVAQAVNRSSRQFHFPALTGAHTHPGDLFDAPKAPEVVLPSRNFYVRKSKFIDSGIMAALKCIEAGLPVPEMCRELRFSSATFCKWRAKFGSMSTIPRGAREGARRREPVIS